MHRITRSRIKRESKQSLTNLRDLCEVPSAKVCDNRYQKIRIDTTCHVVHFNVGADSRSRVHEFTLSCIGFLHMPLKRMSYFLILLTLVQRGDAFVPSTSHSSWTHGVGSTRDGALSCAHRRTQPGGTECRLALVDRPRIWKFSVRSTNDDDEPSARNDAENPYADPNYPDLEFVNYADPEYYADQGSGDEFYDSSNASTEEEIEKMREERRKQNDEYQFQTYFAEILKNGDTFKGEWTVYKSSSFLNHVASDSNGLPRLVKVSKPLKVQSRAYKIFDPEERIIHEEVLATESSDPYESWQRDLDVDRGFGSHDELDGPITVKSKDEDNAEASTVAEETLITYWPQELQKLDFRGQQGIMCVGNAYTVATAVPMDSSQAPHEGPFREYRTEIGIQSKTLRFRVKLNYAVAEAAAISGKDHSAPPLLLKTLVVCREARELWPRPGKYNSVADRWSENGLFGKPGAPGGLYDPPPIDEAQAQRYMLLDLEGQATVLFPYQMDQASGSFDGNGWVSSLDWTPGSMRFQVDRKVNGGKDILGLRTLELSEVQSKDAETYRPRDGGQHMRQ